MAATSTTGWRAVLEETRAYNARSRPAAIDWRVYWRGHTYRRSRDTAEPLLRARAFESVLTNVPLHVCPGEAIVGSRAGFTTDTRPDWLAPEEYERAVAAHRERGQRTFLAGFDHSLGDYATLLQTGIDGFLNRVRAALETRSGKKERDALQAMGITLEALRFFAWRWADACRRAGASDNADRLERIAGPPPRTFHDALQLIWLVHIAFASEGRAHMALGRLDQLLYPFYVRDLASDRLDPEHALDLLCHLWARVEELGEVTNICIGGTTPDGRDATNDLSYLMLQATAQVQSPHTNVSARFHDGSPARFHRACFECIRTGVGFPAIFNDHVLVQGLTEIGVPPEIARDHCMVGCIETMLPGRQPAWSDSRFNTPLCLLRALQRLSAQAEPAQYEDLIGLFREELAHAVADHARQIDRAIAQFPVDRYPDPFLSALTRSCIERARDINDGGAEWPRFHGIAVMGLATVADSLAALKTLVFEQRRIELPLLMTALAADFEGAEPLRQSLLNDAPKYGNGDPRVDSIAADIVTWAADECLRHRLACGGRYVSAMAANVSNIPAGREVGATPDGRKAGTPLSDAASPTFGRDRNGPTAFLQSVAQPDYHRVLTGSVVNMKFEPEHFLGEPGVARFAAFTQYFVRNRIQQLQFNFTGNDLLRRAQADPAAHPGLVVRVSGFSAYFTRLARDVQDDVIRRRAHT